MMAFSKKPVFLIVALLLLAALFPLFFHHHNDARDFDQCAVCKFVRQVFVFFFLMLVIFISEPFQKFFFSYSSRLNSLLFASRLRSRAPPFLS